MTLSRLTARALLVLFASVIASTTSAQSLGTYRWQLEPYCNVVTVNVTQIGDVFTLGGWDDQCGTLPRAPLGVSNNIYLGTDVCESDPPRSNTIRIGRPGGHNGPLSQGCGA